MKKLLAIVGLALVAPALVLAQNTPATTRRFSESQALTRAAPSAASDGMVLGSVIGYRVTVCAEATRTLSGGGNLRAWYYDADSALWMRNPSLDIAVSASSVRCMVAPDVVTQVSTFLSDRVLYAADSVTVSAGTTVTVTIKAITTRVAR